MIRHTLKRHAGRALAASMAVVLATTLSACGGGDDKPAAGQQEVTKIRVASAGLIPTNADLLWAIEGGFFKKRGLDVEMTPPIYSEGLANAVIQGDAEFAVATPTLVATARNAGRPLKVVATIASPFPLSIAFTHETDAKLRAQGLSGSSDISDLFKALTGMTLGTNSPGSPNTAVFRYLLGESGITPEADNITLQPMADIASQVAAVANRRVDGVVSTLGGASTGIAAQGTGVVWELSKMEGNEALKKIPFAGVVASDSFITKNPETVQSYIAALSEAQQSIRAGLSAEVAASFKEKLGAQMDQKHFDDTMAQVESLYPSDFATSDDSWNNVRKVAEVLSGAKVNVAAEDAINNSFATKLKQ